jgi:hypothetical protein
MNRYGYNGMGAFEEVLPASMWSISQSLNDVAHIMNIIKQIFALMDNHGTMKFTGNKRTEEVKSRHFPGLAVESYEVSPGKFVNRAPRAPGVRRRRTN